MKINLSKPYEVRGMSDEVGRLLIGDRDGNKYISLDTEDQLWINTVKDGKIISSQLPVARRAYVASSLGEDPDNPDQDGLSEERIKELIDLLKSIRTDLSSKTTTIQSSDNGVEVTDKSTKLKHSSSGETGSKESSISQNESTIDQSVSDTTSNGFKELLGSSQSSSQYVFKSDFSDGNNMIKNSSFTGGLKYWTFQSGSAETVYEDSIPSTVSTSSMHISYGTKVRAIQEVKTDPSEVYSISVIVKVAQAGTDFNWSGINVYSENKLILQLGLSEVHDYEVLKGSFKASSSSIRIEILSDTNSESYISSLMMNQGPTPQSWETNNDDETETSLVFNKSGLSLSSSDGKMVIGNTGVSRVTSVDGVKRVIFDINDNTSLIRSLNVSKDLLIGGVKAVPVNGLNANGIAFM